MRIGIDIRKYYDYGIGTYIQNLVNVYRGKPGMECVYFAAPDLRSEDAGTMNGEVIVDHSPKYSLQELLSVSTKANDRTLDLFHAPHYTLPFRLSMPSVVTVHDIIHLRMKQYFSAPKRAYAYAMIRHACRSSSAVIVDSAFGKKELLDVFSIPERKVHVIPLGVNAEYFTRETPEQLEAFRKRVRITKPYVLYTGSVKPHKNIPTLLKAMSTICRTNDVHLVFSGESVTEHAELSRMIASYGMNDHVIDLKRVHPDELRMAYQGASAVVLPSFYEGFGFSVLEAMASGVPAIGARAASIPDVIGDAGVLFDPNSAEDLTAALQQVLSDNAHRTALVSKGILRAQQFTWGQCAERTFNVYQEVLQ
jgi:glycosyltransferase involved in cell wall biosynthesis